MAGVIERCRLAPDAAGSWNVSNRRLHSCHIIVDPGRCCQERTVNDGVQKSNDHGRRAADVAQYGAAPGALVKSSP
jgi:hypothetical protein